MKRNVISRIVINLLLMSGSLMLVPNTLNAATCGADYVEGHQVLWENMSARLNVWDWRDDWFKLFYNLQHDDWDGGWGYHGLDDDQPYLKAFPKMMNAAFLLEFGIDHNAGFQSAWKTTSESISHSSSSYGITSRIAAFSRNDESIDAFVIDDERKFWNVVFSEIATDIDNTPWRPGELPNWNYAHEIDVPVKGGFNARFDGSPSVVNRADDAYEIFARSDRHLIQVKMNAEGAFVVKRNVTETPVRATPSNDPFCYQRYCIDSDPVVVSRNPWGLDVFAYDDSIDHLIHYYWTSTKGWKAEDVTELTGVNESDVSHNGNPTVVLHSGSDLISVFVRGDYGELFHYSGSPLSGWTIVNLTKDAISGATNFTIASDPVAVLRGGDKLHVFARERDRYSVMHFYQSSGDWYAQDLTKDLGGIEIDGSPAVLSRTATTLNVFGRAPTFGQLIHYYWTEGGEWKTENLSARFPGGLRYTLSADPVVTGSENRVDVLASGGRGMVHFFWNPSTSWLAENVHFSSGVGFDYLGRDHVVVSRRDDVFDVLGVGAYSIIYLTSASGPTARPWHTNEEYSELASGYTNDFKYSPKYKTEGSEAGNIGAEAVRSSIWSDRVDMYCPSWGQTPADLAETMVHEAAHMVFWGEGGHVESTVRDNCLEPCWDPWLSHGLGSDEGLLPAYGAWESRNHSSYQVGAEYLCDIYEFARPELEFKVYEGARAQANGIMANRILYAPPWSCGLPRPLY